ncbi:MAG: PAS domain S-box protein [Dehalococcoidales bacterium]|nr:PAS domain S-box protein [Dehalococcoidales bacterium]
MSDKNGCLLEASGVSKRLSDYFALRDISVTLNRGEVHVILGENGAGKTTLVRLLTGDIVPDQGNIRVLGKEIKIKSPQQARSLGISIAHQDFVLFPEMSVAANFLLFQDPRRGSLATSSEDLDRARSFLNELDFLTNVDLKAKVSHLSAGQRKQLQIAAAIVQDFPIIILDDPTSYLSDGDMAGLFELLNKLRSQGKGILYTCHRVDEAKRVADRVIVLRDGEIATSIESKSLVSSANLLRGMMGVIFMLRAAPGLPIERVSTNVELELGYKPKVLMAHHVLYEDIIYPDDRQKVENLRQQFAEQGVDHFEREYRIICASGEHKWVHELTRVERDDGVIKSYEIGIVDITEARRAQEALRQSEQKYESLVNNISDVIYSSMPGVSGTRIFLSPRWEDWTGQPVCDIYRDDQMWLSSVHSGDADKVTQAYLEASNKGTEYCVEYRLKPSNNGQVRYVRDHGVPIKEETGRLIGFDGIISDITEVKNLELELRQSREFLSKLIVNAPVPILLFNEDYSVRYSNAALERLTGFTSGEIINSSFPYPWCVAKRRYSPPGKLPSLREEFYQKKNGDRFWVEIASAIVEDQLHERFFLETWNDITREKQFTENLRSYANLVTSALEDERKRLARELHDETIQSLFCLCTDIGNCLKNGRLPAGTHKELELILDRTGGIMNSLRSFCHEMRPDIIDRFGLVPAIKLLVEEMRRHNGPACDFEIVGDVRRLPNDTELALFRIIQEALNNVRRHAKATEVKLSGIFTDSETKIIISDNGVGLKVPPALDNLASYGKLGLVGMNERAYLIGGTLSIDSKKDRGTTITVQVPLRDKSRVPSESYGQDED